MNIKFHEFKIQMFISIWWWLFRWLDKIYVSSFPLVCVCVCVCVCVYIYIYIYIYIYVRVCLHYSFRNPTFFWVNSFGWLWCRFCVLRYDFCGEFSYSFSAVAVWYWVGLRWLPSWLYGMTLTWIVLVQ